MDKQQEQLETLREIRSLMERSSRFLSLSGLTGVIAGLAAIAGIAAVYQFLGLSISEPAYYRFALTENGERNSAFYTFILTDSILVLMVSLLGAAWLTLRRAKQQEQPVWDATSKRLLINLFIPLVAGGIYCLILLYQGHVAFVAPATLIFYGLALLNASKYTLTDIGYMGMLQIITGLVAAVFPEYGLLFWALGFGLIHIVYGITIYLKYEK